MKSECLVECCDRPAKTRGMCAAHTERARRGISLDSPVAVPAKLTDYYEPAAGDTCWIWHGGFDKNGYGRFGSAWAHRRVYETHKGPIPKGFDLDHLCRVIACVNPAHLEPVTHRVNALRGMAPNVVAHVSNKCLKGHELTPENSFVSTKTGRKRCRTCTNEGQRRRKAAKRAALADIRCSRTEWQRMTYAVCGCTELITSETHAQRHAKECPLMGMPAHPTTCRVTVWYMPDTPVGKMAARPCGEPAAEGALCADHAADRRANGRGNR